MHFVRGWGFIDKRSDFPLPSKVTAVMTSLLHHLAAFVPRPLLLIALTPTTACLVIPSPALQIRPHERHREDPYPHSLGGIGVTVGASVSPSAWRRSASRASPIKGAVSPLPLEGDGCDNLLRTSILTPTTTTSCRRPRPAFASRCPTPRSLRNGSCHSGEQLFRLRPAVSPDHAGLSSISARSEGPNGTLTRVTRSLTI